MNIFCRTLLQFSKKKRKRSDSDDDYGEDYEPEEGRRRRGRTAVDDEEEVQDSPKVDDNTERRKSSRSKKATKYVDDTDYGFEDVEGDNAVNIPISNEILPDVSKAPSEGPVSEGAAVDAVTSATPSITGPPGADPEASNASTVPGSTVPGTPIEGVLDTSTNQSGPNYAFVVSLYKLTKVCWFDWSIILQEIQISLLLLIGCYGRGHNDRSIHTVISNGNTRAGRR